MATLSPTPIPHHNASPHLRRSPIYNMVTLPHPRLSLSLHKYSSPLVQFPKLANPISIRRNKSKAQPKIAYDLSFAQKASFAENGYLILSDVLSPTEIISLKIWAQEIHDLPRTPDCPYLPYEEINRLTGERVLCRTENFVSSHKGFDSLLRGKTFMKILEQLAGKEMLLFKEKINYKLAGAGGFSAHIDKAGYGKFKNLQHLSIMIAVDPSTVENGCLEVVERSHRVEIPISSDNTIDSEWEKRQKWKPVEMQAGQLLIFGTSLAHRSGPNNSSRDRRAVYATYNPKSDGDQHDAYYEKRAKGWPATHKREKGVDYSTGAQSYAYGTPMLSVGVGGSGSGASPKK